MKIKSSIFWLSLMLLSGIFMFSCDDDAPPAENEEEEIAQAVLTFTPTSGGTPLTFSYTAPVGTANPVIEPIVLKENTTYRLDVDLFGPAGEDIGQEVGVEGAEHQLFFGWTNNLFSNPAGNGNIDAPQAGAVNYVDLDVNNLPIGLATTWTTANVEATALTGLFEIILKHQPDAKTATSGVNVGTTDLEVEWPISVVE